MSVDWTMAQDPGAQHLLSKDSSWAVTKADDASDCPEWQGGMGWLYKGQGGCEEPWQVASILTQARYSQTSILVPVLM